MKELSNEQERKLDEFIAHSRFCGTAEEFTVRTAWKKCLESNGLDSPNAVVIDPDKLDWPEWSTCLRVMFYNIKETTGEDGERFFNRITLRGNDFSELFYLPRPKPAWQPKYGAWNWIWKWGCTEKFASDDPNYLDIKSTRIAAVLDFENEKNKPWEFFVSRGECRESQEV